MSLTLKTILALAMILVGGVKTVLHMSTAQTLLVDTCGGRLVALPLGDSGMFAASHCWGCYMLAAGLVTIAAIVLEPVARPRAMPLRVD